MKWVGLTQSWDSSLGLLTPSPDTERLKGMCDNSAWHILISEPERVASSAWLTPLPFVTWKTSRSFCRSQLRYSLLQKILPLCVFPSFWFMWFLKADALSFFVCSFIQNSNTVSRSSQSSQVIALFNSVWTSISKRRAGHQGYLSKMVYFATISLPGHLLCFSKVAASIESE